MNQLNTKVNIRLSPAVSQAYQRARAQGYTGGIDCRGQLCQCICHRKMVNHIAPCCHHPDQRGVVSLPAHCRS